MPNKNIECRGRNGWFKYGEHSVSVVPSIEKKGERKAYVLIRSSRYGKSAPIQFYGEPEDIKILLKDIIEKL